MAMMPIDVIPCVKVPGTTLKIPLSYLEKHLPISASGMNNRTASVLFSTGIQDHQHHQWDLSSLLTSELLSLNDSMANLTETQPEHDSIISNPLYLSISTASAVGNLIMLLVVLCKQRFRKPVNLLVANLSLSSFLFILSSNLRLLENSAELWTYTTFICQCLAVLHRIPVPVIALTTMMISLDRGRIARNPMLGTNSNPMWKILYIWIFSVVILIPLGLSRQYDTCITTSPYKCSKVVILDNPTIALMYGVIYLLSVHIIPAIILVLETMKTINKIRFLKVSGTTQQSFQSLPDNRLRLLRNSCIFCIIFLFFWLPYGVFQFPLDLPREILPEILEAYIHIYFKFFRNVTYILIALNPVILFVLSYDICKHASTSGTQWRI